jgi:hypothetical protein
MLAAFWGNVDVVRLLLEREANVEVKNSVRRGALASAPERLDGTAHGEPERPRGGGAAAAKSRGVARRDQQRERPLSLHASLQDGKNPIDVVCIGYNVRYSQKPAIEALLRDGALP